MPNLMQYLEQNPVHMEGYTAVNDLERTIREVCGYGKHSFGGKPITEFLSDNPGAIETLYNWIAQQSVQEWNDNLDNLVYEDEDEDEDPEDIAWQENYMNEQQ